MYKHNLISEEEKNKIKSLYGLISENPLPPLVTTTTTKKEVIQQYDFYTIDSPIKGPEFLETYIAQMQEKGLIGDTPNAVDFYEVKRPFVAKNILGKTVKYLPGQRVRFNL